LEELKKKKGVVGFEITENANVRAKISKVKQTVEEVTTSLQEALDKLAEMLKSLEG
jgi:hypothetical protein